MGVIEVTDELKKSIAQLSAPTLTEALKAVGRKVDKKKDVKPDLVRLYEDAVMDAGIEKFINKLSKEQVEQTSKALEADGSDSAAVIKKIQEIKIEAMINKLDSELLKTFCGTVGLDITTERAEMEKGIADEAMLSGMEAFLHKLGEGTLKKHCKELKLKDVGDKKNLVERLMVHIFDLEPLEGDEKEEEEKKENGTEDKAEKKGSSASKKSPKKSSEKKEKSEKKAKKEKDEDSDKKRGRPKRSRDDAKEDKEEDYEEEEEEQPKKKAKKEKKEKKEKDEKTPRQPYVSPAIETIVKGKYTTADLHNKFNASVLIDYCKKHGLYHNDKKKDIIKRVHHHAETGEKLNPKTKKVGKKPKKTIAKKAASPSKGSPKKGRGKKAAKSADAEKESKTEESK